jgi:hypothetical protein
MYSLTWTGVLSGQPICLCILEILMYVTGHALRNSVM